MVVLFLLIQVPAGIAMIVPVLEQDKLDALYIVHKGLGSILLVVILARAIWRLTHPAPPMSTEWPELERRIASRTHVFIYFLLVVVAVSGYVRVISGGFPIELLNVLGIPPLL